ncbi:hypothetical protein [Halorubrum lacusprofundi]|jgi:hypothetical protein|uniref:Cox cluster protein n=1 Tax=Halorubrum lacusprofundi (strain ATCC 49239 / DSM 5036 / JCM 8891 / ACAM 34) TaxID=416348 RepID=B9LMN7_HALLT|nr:hypothetical protein [Halorubrum lacusprofundi]ACM56625.1 conserved hypothetical protein [Halorubrum lacusprofundi ATCC 49239]MCG1005110.1 hypothetical protein [Halorubrum lacusprofundi]
MTDIIDKAAMALSAGLMLLGIVGMGILEVLVGAPYGPVPLTNEAGDVIATPLFSAQLRTGVVLAGIAVLGLYAAYKIVTPLAEDAQTGHETIAD